ncbi:MAG: oligosaccharide flippase family protein [Nitrospirota bacterium]
MNGLIKRTATYLISGLISQGAIFCLWLTLPWLLTPAEVGYVTLALFVIEVLTLLGMMGMDSALIRFASQPDDRRKTLTIATAISGVGLIIVAVLTYTALHISIPFLVNTVLWVSSHYGLVLIAVAANVAWNLFQSYQLAARQAREYAVFQVVRALVYLSLAVGALTLLAKDASTVIWAATVSSIGVLSLLVRKASLPSFSGDVFQKKEIGLIMRYGFPLMLYGLLGVGLTYTQRLVLDHYADVSVLGVFGFFNVIAIQLNGLWASINKSWTPEFFILIKENKERAIRLLQGMLSLVCVVYPMLLAAYVVLGETIINEMVFPAAYAAQAEIFYLLLLAMLFTGVYTVAYPLYYYDLRTRRILGISLFLAVANMGLSVVLIRLWGIVGAAVSYLILAVMTLWTYMIVFRDWTGGWHRTAVLLVVVTVMVGGAATLLVATHSSWMFVASLLTISVVAWLLGGVFAKPMLKRLYGRIHIV